MIRFVSLYLRFGWPEKKTDWCAELRGFQRYIFFSQFFLQPFLSKLCLLEVTTFIPQTEKNKKLSFLFLSPFKAVISYLYEFKGATTMKWVTLGILYSHDPNCSHRLSQGEGQRRISRGIHKLPKVSLWPTTLLCVGGYPWNSFMATSRVATHK